MTTSVVNEQKQQLDEVAVSKQHPKAASFDCWKTDNTIALSGDFPGFNAAAFRIEFHDQVLTIHGAPQKHESFGTPLRCEFERRALERSFRIQDEVDPDGIKATFYNGVLTIMLPIVPPISPRRIPVSSS